MPVLYLIWALVLVLAAPLAAQDEPSEGISAGYTVFFDGAMIGREELTVREDASGIVITGAGRLSNPFNVVTRRVEVRYDRDWTPVTLDVDLAIGNEQTAFRTTFSGATAQTDGTLAGQQISEEEAFSQPPVILPNAFFGSYVAIARLIATGADPNREYLGFLGPQLPTATIRVTATTSERMQTGTELFTVYHHELVFSGPAGDVPVDLFADENGSLVRLNIPSQGLDVIRDDVAAPTARTEIYSHPGDEAVIVPAAGFNLGATLTRPQLADGSVPSESTRLPAVVIVPGTGNGDRDGLVEGVYTMGQIAGALADAGFLVVRYDKRGTGQSGGRSESATLRDYSEDARGVFRWLRDRRDVDRDRIALIGHAEGGWVAMLTASRERRVAALGLISTPSVTGEEFVLEQQRNVLDQTGASPDERAERIALQQAINSAVIDNRGLEELPEDVRRQANTPWFRSLLTFDPASVIEDVRAPMLIVHGELDQQVPVIHIERLAELARTESRSIAVEVVTVRGVNHLLVPAVTGDISEYPTLEDRNVSVDVTGAVSDWLTRMLPSARR